MWARALTTTALRRPAKGLLVASIAGWIATAWLLAREPMSHMSVGHSPAHVGAVWVAMVLAMAPPLLLREIGHLWRTSLRRLRPFTISWFVSGYVGIWLLAGVVLLAILESISARPERIAVTLVLVVLWLMLTRAPALPQCLPPSSDAARVRSGRAGGLAAVRNLDWFLLRRGLRCSDASGVPHGAAPLRCHGYRRCFDDLRTTSTGKAAALADPDRSTSGAGMAGYGAGLSPPVSDPIAVVSPPTCAESSYLVDDQSRRSNREI